MEYELLQLETKEVSALLEPQPPEDDDLLFFKSLMPYIKQLHPLQKLRFRSTIQNTLLSEMSSQQFSHGQQTSCPTSDTPKTDEFMSIFNSNVGNHIN